MRELEVCWMLPSLIFRINVVIAGIQAAVVLQGHTFAAEFVINAELRFLAHPLRDRGLEQIDEHLAHVAAVPLIPHLAEKIAPVVRIDRPLRHHGIRGAGMRGGRVVQRQRGGVPHLRRDVAKDLGLDAGNELHLPRPYFVLQEAIDIQRPLRVDAVHHRQRVERHAMLVQHLRRRKHLFEGRLAILGYAIRVVQFFRAIDAQTHEETVLA